MLTFPTHLFNPVRIQLRPAGAVIEGGESLLGEVDTIRTDGGGYWVCAMAGIELLTADHIRAWRAWEAELDNGVTKVLIPIADVRQAPRPVVGGVLSRPSQLKNNAPDDPYFPEAVGFATPWIEATSDAAAAHRATEIWVNVARGARLKGGEHFAVAHPTVGRRVYRVGRILERHADLDGGARVSIRPPLREALADNTPLDFDWPSFVGKLLPNVDISPEISYGRAGTVDIAFREAF